MNKFLEFLKTIWDEIDSVIELFVYLGIAFAVSEIFKISYLQAIGIVFVYFILNLLRLLVEIFRNRNR